MKMRVPFRPNSLVDNLSIPGSGLPPGVVCMVSGSRSMSPETRAALLEMARAASALLASSELSGLDAASTEQAF